MTHENTPEVTVTPYDLGMVEIIDEQGNPTGQYRTRTDSDGEATYEGTPFTVTEDSADHRIN